MRKLTVKNFSVIKDAELEFGKITVLIGPQSSGKSLLCKLAYFLGQIVPEIANGLLLLRMPYSELQTVVESEFKERFPVNAWGTKRFEIKFVSRMSTISIRRILPSSHFTVEFDPEFIARYNEWKTVHGAEGSASDLIRSIRNDGASVSGPIKFDESIYIPTGRSFFSTPNRGFASMATKNLDWVTQRFAATIDWEYKALIDSSSASSDPSRQFLEDVSTIVGGKVLREDGLLLFQSNSEVGKLPFQLLSSGTAELLPLLNPLGGLLLNLSASPLRVWVQSDSTLGPIFVEEPELSIFPKTQYNLVRLFAWLSNESQLNFPFAITTHSPYILSSFNNLLEAWQVGHADEDRGDATRKIIEEKYWVNPQDFRAYSIEEHRLVSIMDEETHLISDNFLDSISERIGGEFDELLRIGYVEA